MGKLRYIFLLLIVLASCQKKGCENLIDIADSDMVVEFEDLTHEIHNLKNEAELSSFLKANPVIRDQFFYAADFKTEEAMLKGISEMLNNAYLDTLYREIHEIFDVYALEAELSNAFKRMNHFYPDFKAPKVKLAYSGFGKDVFLSDTLLVIGLDYYLGEQASFRPNEFEYVKARLTPDHLVPQIVQFMSNKFNETNLDDRSILDEMVFYGKSLQFTKTMLPCTPDSLIMGYTAKQLADSEVSEGFLWAYFVDNSLLFNKKPLNIAKFIDERPGIPEIDRACPGRIGQWLGWRIVNQYVQESGEDFKTLMTRKDAGQLLTQSRYKPRNR